MAIEICSQFLLHIFIQGLAYIQEFYDIACKIYCHQNIRKKEQLNCHLDLVVYDNSIAVTIEDKCDTCTFLIDTFTDYITIFHSIKSN